MFRKLCLTCGMLVYIALVVFGRNVAGHFANQPEVTPQATSGAMLGLAIRKSRPADDTQDALPRCSAEE